MEGKGIVKRQQIKRNLGLIERIKTWQLLILLVLSLFVSATFLRLNRVGLNERMQAVVSADEVGDIVVMQERLYDLQRYAGSHMNAQPEDIYLTHQYERDVKNIVEQAQAKNAEHSNILKLADDACRPHYSGYTQGYVQCIRAEQEKYPPSENPSDSISLPNPIQYRHTFVSPLWSADFAGWSVVISLFFGLLIIIRLILYAILKLMLKRQYRAI